MEKLRKIGNAESKDFEILPGNHLLQAKIDWCSSSKIDFHISENETKCFKLSSFAKGNSLALLLALYYISFGANKYLDLKELQ